MYTRFVQYVCIEFIQRNNLQGKKNKDKKKDSDILNQPTPKRTPSTVTATFVFLMIKPAQRKSFIASHR